MCAVYPLGLLALARMPAASMQQRAAFAACVLVGISWVHHAAVRSDPRHLAEAAQPLWLLLFTAPAAFGGPQRRRLALISGSLLIALTLAVPLFADARWRGLVSDDWGPIQVGDDEVRAPQIIVLYATEIEAMIHGHLAADEPILITPFEPGFYPFLGKKAPTYDLYQLWPSPPAAQRRAVAALERADVRWAFLGTRVIDRRPEMHLSRTNPLVFDYLFRNFEKVAGAPVWPGSLFLKRREPDAAPPAVD
jgi:hypothetical protein